MQIFSRLKIKNFWTTKDVIKNVKTSQRREEDICMTYNPQQIVYNQQKISI